MTSMCGRDSAGLRSYRWILPSYVIKPTRTSDRASPPSLHTHIRLTSPTCVRAKGVSSAPSGRRLRRAVGPSQGTQYEAERMARGLALPGDGHAGSKDTSG
ncbi:hypothetical protein EYF80_035571 [Liparis tanakae]|uniref:Uncharacterized protein n=1 Tax=Liparis tanakae TaxID=230148 RepID=A0A4Z2GLJ6_9TELE|nr:hypothetical protein EYF80_035571 [Liparis tanakae]